MDHSTGEEALESKLLLSARIGRVLARIGRVSATYPVRILAYPVHMGAYPCVSAVNTEGCVCNIQRIQRIHQYTHQVVPVYMRLYTVMYSQPRIQGLCDHACPMYAFLYINFERFHSCWRYI